MRVHITLDEATANDPIKRERFRNHLTETTNLRDINENRLTKYGIISGQMDPEFLEGVSALTEVLAVEMDQTKHTC